MSLCGCKACSAMPIDPFNPAFHRNPATGIAPTHEWGPECQRGFVREERFGAGQTVMSGANRNKTRAVYRVAARLADK